MTTETIASRLRFLREKHGVSLSTACRASGMSKGHLSQLERGIATNPGIHSLQALAGYYGVPVASLLGEHPPYMELRVQRLAGLALRCDDDVLALLEQVAERLGS